MFAVYRVSQISSKRDQASSKAVWFTSRSFSIFSIFSRGARIVPLLQRRVFFTLGIIGSNDTDALHLVADREPGHALADRLDRTCGLVAEPARQLRLLQIHTRAKHGFRPVETECTHTQPQLAGSWCADIHLVDLQNLGATGLMKLNHARHHLLLFTDIPRMDGPPASRAAFGACS